MSSDLKYPLIETACQISATIYRRGSASAAICVLYMMEDDAYLRYRYSVATGNTGSSLRRRPRARPRPSVGGSDALWNAGGAVGSACFSRLRAADGSSAGLAVGSARGYL